MSSTGTTIDRSHDFSAGGATTRTGCGPPRNAATRSGGRTVADRPIRCKGCREDEEPPSDWVSASSRSRETSRWDSTLATGQGVHLVDDHCPD